MDNTPLKTKQFFLASLNLSAWLVQSNALISKVLLDIYTCHLHQKLGFPATLRCFPDHIFVAYIMFVITLISKKTNPTVIKFSFRY